MPTHTHTRVRTHTELLTQARTHTYTQKHRCRFFKGVRRQELTQDSELSPLQHALEGQTEISVQVLNY